MIKWFRAQWSRLFPRGAAQAGGAAPASFDDAAQAALRARREALVQAGIDDASLPPPGSLGLAVSGGGVRSATIALGAAQALAQRGRLLDFDYLSTVSGGGYFGTFLRSLFIPLAQRGLTPGTVPVSTGDALKAQLRFAQAVLASGASQKEVEAPIDPANAPVPMAHLRNPIWWLREHGRYLAPNGSSDYAAALAYMSRNWVAMIFVIALAMAALFLTLTGLLWFVLQRDPAIVGWNMLDLMRGIVPALSCDPVIFAAGDTHFLAGRSMTSLADVGRAHGGARLGPALYDPILFAVPLTAVLGLATGIAYWFTQWLPAVPGRSLLRWPRLVTFVGTAGAGAALVALGSLLLRPLCGYPTMIAGLAAWTLVLLPGLALAVLLFLAVSVLTRGTRGFVPELRSRLTRLLAKLNTATLVLLALGAIGTIALALRPWVASVGKDPPTTIATGFLLPAGAWLISQLPKWFSGGGKVSGWLRGHIRFVALLAGLLLFGSLAVLVDLFVQSVVWPDGAWQRASAAPGMQWSFYLACFSVVAGLAVLIGSSTSFINMSSLHNLYAARLTRAYLGATNVGRLGEPRESYKPITESHPRDDLPVSFYAQLRTCAPLHLINVTLNETKSREASQLVERDRKGVPIVFAPEGVLVDPACGSARGDYWLTWDELDKAGVESLSVGQLCAISGAAASTGMGARTSLGTALAMSFANVRLGYWWRVGNILRQRSSPRKLDYVRLLPGRPLRAYRYLWNEMTSQYSRDFERLYLSDGGHFENSAAYELLRRRVPAILVLDNGADPAFAFEDLENLIRKARIDLGLSVNVLSGAAVTALFGREASPFFFNGDQDWRAKARAPGGTAVALALCVYAPNEDSSADPQIVSHMLWVKPRLSASLPHDVQGYGRANPAFPQETTADQFFGEAQWESYRAVGYGAMDALLSATFHKGQLLRRLATL